MRAGHSGMPDDMRTLNESTFKQNIQEYDTADLLKMNKMIVARIRKLRSLETKKFTIGQRVSFKDNTGLPRNGTVTRRNKKTVSIRTDSGSEWRVAPEYLS